MPRIFRRSLAEFIALSGDQRLNLHKHFKTSSIIHPNVVSNMEDRSMRAIHPDDVFEAYKQKAPATVLKAEKVKGIYTYLVASDLSNVQIGEMFKSAHQTVASISRILNARTTEETRQIEQRNRGRARGIEYRRPEVALQIDHLLSTTRTSHKNMAKSLGVHWSVVARRNKARKIRKWTFEGRTGVPLKSVVAMLMERERLPNGNTGLKYSLKDVAKFAGLHISTVEKMAKKYGRTSEENLEVRTRKHSDKTLSPIVRHMVEFLKTNIVGSSEVFREMAAFDERQGKPRRPYRTYSSHFMKARKILGLPAFPRTTGKRRKQLWQEFERVRTELIARKLRLTIENFVREKSIIPEPIMGQLFKELQEKRTRTQEILSKKRGTLK